jgi:hypothetical protein
MEYKLKEVQQKVQEFADKMNSDYFPLPVFLNHFETATHKFIGEKLRIIESNQEVVEDIRTLIQTGKLTVIKDANDTTRYIAALPTDYLQQIAYDVFYKDGTRCRRADMKKHSQKTISYNDPNQQPTKQYPNIFQESSLFHIECGSTAVPDYMKITYCKKPSFATTGKPETRIVNLPDQAIENIILTTVTRLFATTGDERMQSQYTIEEAFRKVFR